MKKLLTLLAFSCLACASVAHAATEKRDPMKDPKSDKAAGPVNLARIFDKKLIDADGKPVDAAKLAKVKYVVVYFSVHDSAPCRKFTPELVKFTEENRKDGNFEVVSVCFDKDTKAMQAYMKEAKMSWGGMIGRGAELPGVRDDISDIPYLRLFDAKGKIVVDSVDATGQYVGPNYVLRELKKLLAK